MDKLETVKQYLKNNNYNTEKIELEYIDQIYDILINGNYKQYDDCNNKIIFHYIGLFLNVNKNYDEMKKILFIGY